MADPTWPSTIPSEPERDGYSEAILTNLTSFQPDVGPPTSWRRSTLEGAQISGTIIMTDAERDLFLTFFRTTLQDGSRAFNWTNPAYGVSARYIFDPNSPPDMSTIGYGLWRVRFTMIKLS